MYPFLAICPSEAYPPITRTKDPSPRSGPRPNSPSADWPYLATPGRKPRKKAELQTTFRIPFRRMASADFPPNPRQKLHIPKTSTIVARRKRTTQTTNTHTSKMPRQRSVGRAPSRPTAPASKPAPTQARPATTMAAPPQHAAPPAAPPAAAAPSQGPGLFGQMASTAAYVPSCPSRSSS